MLMELSNILNTQTAPARRKEGNNTTMKTKHTKGEWINLGYRVDVYIADGLSGICEMSDWMPQDEMEANAKMIAAAPDLLGALIETDKDLCVLETNMLQIELTDPKAEGMSKLVKEWRERNKEAIKKATE